MKYLIVPMIAAASTLSAFADFDELMKQGDAYDRKSECGPALDSYIPAEKLQPNNAGLLVKISRQYALRMADLPTDAQKLGSGRTALGYAERALALQPNECDPNLCVAVCLGKMTPYLSAREKVEASRRIKAATEKAVKIAPNNDLAWHMLGRWHQSLANIGGATRAVAGMVYGGVPAASNDEAVRCFNKAIALNPDRLIHMVELGRTYALMGRKEEARKYLEKGLAMPNKEKDDPETKARARASLKDIS